MMSQSTVAHQNPFKWILKILMESMLLTSPIIIGIIVVSSLYSTPAPHQMPLPPTAQDVPAETITPPTQVKVQALAAPSVAPPTEKLAIQHHNTEPAPRIKAKVSVKIKPTTKPMASAKITPHTKPSIALIKTQPTKPQKTHDDFKMLEQSLSISP